MSAVRRSIALMSLAAVFGGGGWGALAFFRHQRRALSGPPTPFRADPLVGVGPDLRRMAVPPGPAVVIYASARCPYCRAELRSWSRLLADHPGLRRPWVVFAPGTRVREARALCGAFAGHWMTDPTGAVARGLRVQAVPFVAVMDSGGMVEEAHAGMSSPERLASLAAFLSRIPRRYP